MALITCPDCGKQVSDRAAYCPNCGCPSSAWQTGSFGISSSLRVGQRFRMGNWGGEPIEWRVLQASGNRAYVISEYGLDCVQFNFSRKKGNSWETSDLKAWLDNTFLPRAFSDSERAAIQEITCLSINEVETLFKNDSDRFCSPTVLAVRQGVCLFDSKGSCRWWLRSPGKNSTDAAFVGYSGIIFEKGDCVVCEDFAVRPALVLNL